MKTTASYLFIFLATATCAFSQSAIEALDTSVNTRYNEFNPVLSPDGSILFFTRASHPENAGGKSDPGDIWFSKWEDDRWSEPVNAGEPLNNRNFNAVVGFSQDGSEVFLHDHYKKGGGKYRIPGVSVSSKTQDGWSFPQPVSVRYFHNKSDHQSISLSPDGRAMLMSLESYGSYGAEDIYVSFLQPDGSWSAPANLGSAINTKFQEMTPALLKDNKTLIFASNGRGGAGSMDLFYSERLDDTWKKWSPPVNLGAINTRGRDFYYAISPDDEYVYFVSTQNSEGYGDIKRMRLDQDDLAKQVEAAPSAPLEEAFVSEATGEGEGVDSIEAESATASLTGKIFNRKNNEPVNGKIVALSAGEEKIAEAENGSYRISLEPGAYTVRISAKGYMHAEYKVVLTASGQSAQTRNFALDPLEVGSTFRLESVLFHRGTTDLLDSSYLELNRVVDMMKENPGLEIELGGHTDNVGNARLNLKLSQERVDAVRNYLIEAGIDQSRIHGKGYGGSKPIASNKDEETRRLNRRVEFTVLRNNSDAE